MPVNIIDTLKPKNGLSFPVVEAIDVFVENYGNLADAVSHFATDVMIEAINAVLSGKANTSDLTAAMTNLQNQIDQIAQTAGTGTADTEIGQARVGSDGTSYQTLKERLDSENTTINTKIAEIGKVGRQYLNKSAKENGYYYLNANNELTIGGGTDWYFPAIPVVAGVTYTLYEVYFPYVIFYDGETYTVINSDNATESMHYTPLTDGKLYVTVSKWYINHAMVTDFSEVPNEDNINSVKLSDYIKFKKGQIVEKDVDFMSSDYQYLIKSKAIAGKYYTRNAEITDNNDTYYIYDGFEVYNGNAYHYTNIDCYHSVFYDYTTAEWTPLSNDGTSALQTGTFTPAHDGKVYISIKDRAFPYATFCKGNIPDRLLEGYYNTSLASNEKIKVEDTDFAKCNHQLISVQGALQGKYYTRRDVETGSVANRYALAPFKITGGTAYNYSNIDSYHTNVLDLETGVYTPLSNDSEAGASTSGTFTPSHDSLVFATIHERDYRRGMFCDGAVPNNYVEGAYNIKLNGDTETVNDVIIVDVNGTGDYTSLRDAFESIENPTTVYVRNGTYNVRNYYTNEEWEASGFVGLFVPDNTTVIGETRDGVIITATDTSAEVKPLISTLNIANNASLKNLTVKAEHIRYAVHDDWAAAGQNEYTRVIENCVFEGTNLRYYTVYGAGVKQGANWSIRNCKFITHDGYRGFSCHNNLNWDKPSKLSLINNRFEGSSEGFALSFGTLNTDNKGGDLYIELYGNKIGNNEKILLNEETGYGPGIKAYLTGFGNNFNNDKVEIRSSDGQDYSDHVDLF